MTSPFASRKTSKDFRKEKNSPTPSNGTTNTKSIVSYFFVFLTFLNYEFFVGRPTADKNTLSYGTKKYLHTCNIQLTSLNIYFTTLLEVIWQLIKTVM
jgi:hypothetical protein